MDVDKIVPALKFAAIASTGLYCGGVVSTLLADIPSLKEHSHGCILKILRLKFWKVGRLLGPLAVLGASSGIGLYLIDKEKHFDYLVTGSLLAALGPYTRFVVFPVVTPMAEPDAKEKMSEEEVRASVDKFEKLHAIRTLIAVSGFGYLIYSLIK